MKDEASIERVGACCRVKSYVVLFLSFVLYFPAYCRIMSRVIQASPVSSLPSSDYEVRPMCGKRIERSLSLVLRSRFFARHESSAKNLRKRDDTTTPSWPFRSAVNRNIVDTLDHILPQIRNRFIILSISTLKANFVCTGGSTTYFWPISRAGKCTNS